MDEFDKKLFNDLSAKMEIPVRCEYIIKNALKNEKSNKKRASRNIIIIVARTFGVALFTAGTVFASAKVYENVWKEPEKIERFYGTNGEWYSTNIDIKEKKAISEEEARIKFKEILDEFEYENEIIRSIELIDNPSDDSLFYRAITENEFILDLDAKNPSDFKIFTNIAYKDINEYRGNKNNIENVAKTICEKHKYDLSKYNHKEVKFNAEEPENANIWQVKYNKEYDEVVNIYEEITIGIIPEINELYYFIYTNKPVENTGIIVSKEEATDIALAKENQLNIGYNIKNIESELDIVKMNGYAYLRENDFKKYYEQRYTPLYPIEKLQYYRVEERIRKVWRVKLEFETTKDTSYKEKNFTYFVDTSTGEIVGGE